MPVRCDPNDDGNSFAVLKADLLLLQKRIDLLGYDKIPISCRMQEQEKFVISLPANNNAAATSLNGTTEDASDTTKRVLFEALLNKIQELCVAMLKIGGKDLDPNKLLLPIRDGHLPSPRDLRSASQPLPAVSSTAAAHSAFSLSCPFGPNTSAGRESYVHTFIAFTDAVAASSIDNFRSTASKLNLESEWRETIAKIQQKCNTELEEMNEKYSRITQQQQQQFDQKVSLLQTEINELKQQLKMRDDKDPRNLKGFIPIKDHQK
jgi:hypothetical protein